MTRRDWIRAGGGAAAVVFASRGRAQHGTRDPSELRFDAGRVPLSRSGSYLAIGNHFWSFGTSPQVSAGDFYVRCLQDDPSPPETFRIELWRNGAALEFTSEATPGSLVLRSGAGARVEFCIAEMNVVRVRGSRCELRLHTVIGSYANAVRVNADRWYVMPDATRSPVQVKRLSGSMAVDAPWVDDHHHVQPNRAIFTFAPSSDAGFECALEFFEGAPGSRNGGLGFDEANAGVASEFETWAARVPALTAEFEPSRRLAAYVLWSSTVAPRGLYRTPIVLGSKNWMARIWSWDHCFAALGLAAAHPELAWQQFLVFQQMQDPVSGVLADSMSTIKKSWVCTKNPVHGWALRHLMRRVPEYVTDARLREAYTPLRLWTEYWITERDLDRDGLPCLLHPNESFDNTTANTMDGAVKTPETATYLAVQMEVLSEVATRLGDAAEAELWRGRRDRLIGALLSQLWDARGQRFVTKRVGDGRVGPGDSVLAFVPLLLGKRLPSDMRRALVAGLKEPGRFLTPSGFSTEALTSPLYEADSYVKGPVWAPPNVFLSEGLEMAGEQELASEVRRRFSHACRKAGMSEHFDARTGAPAGDPAYIWTAAMYLFLNDRRVS